MIDESPDPIYSELGIRDRGMMIRIKSLEVNHSHTCHLCYSQSDIVASIATLLQVYSTLLARQRAV